MAMTLDDLISRTTRRDYVAMHPNVTRFGWIGASLSFAAAWVYFTLPAPSGPRPGFFLVGWGLIRGLLSTVAGEGLGFRAAIVIAGLLGIVAVWTGGFRSGPLLFHSAAVGLSALGLISLLPLAAIALVAAANLTIWVAFGVLMAIVGALVGALLVWMCFAALMNS
jgi:hypothetical protein